MVRVFLSYSRQDRAIAEALSHELRGRGVEVWSDFELTVGADWRIQITDALRQADVVIVVVTPSGLQSQWVMKEWSVALRDSKRVIPVLAGGAQVSDLPSELRDIQAADLNRDFADGVRSIVEAVTALSRLDEPPPDVDLQAIVEDIVERKLASLGVDRRTESVSEVAEDPNLVFVVASFQADMEPAFEAIETAARTVGLKAERVKDVVGDYRITDRILGSIRRARLIVVDLTHERPNVYFELGYARGLGKSVITIMKKGTRAHFDVQDWTYLSYADSRPLERDLIVRFRGELEQRQQ